MQNKIQVNQVLREFSRYGMLLYILTAIFFYQTIVSALIFITVIFKPDFYNNFLLIDLISDRIVTTAILIVLLILMLMAIKIHSKAHETSTKNFIIFSVLWFSFYVVAQIILWLPIIVSIITQTSINPISYIYLNFETWAAAILSTISQLIVWISVHKFFVDNNDIFPMKTTRGILNSLTLLMITMGITLVTEAIFFLISYAMIAISIGWGGIPYFIPYLGFQQTLGIPSEILSIVGYSLLGYRLGKLKTSIDTLVPVR